MRRKIASMLLVIGALSLMGGPGALGEEAYFADPASLSPMAGQGALEILDDPALSAFIEDCAEPFGQAVTYQGEAFALPVAVEGWCLCYDPQVLEAMNLTEKDLPRSWEELFPFLTRWNRQWANSGYLPMYPLGLRSSLMYALLSDYQEAHQADEAAFQVDTPLFRQLMEGLRTADLSYIDHENSTQGVKGYLFGEYDLAHLLSQPQLVPWPLALERGGTPVIGVQLTVAALPKGSDEKALLTCLAEITPSMQALLQPADAQPVADPQFETQLAQWQAHLETLTRQQAQGALDVSRQIDDLQKRLEHPEDYQYLIHPQRLAAYREKLLPLMRLTQPVNPHAPDEFYTLQQRFLEGELSTAQFVREVERALKK